MANTAKEKELKTEWPITKGRTARTTKQAGMQQNLIPEGKLGTKTTILKKNRRGLG
ncbi:MAG: hypothetical protein ACOC5T_01895 [Elusimicrobiota bacterium]